MNVDTELERHVRQVLSTVAAATPIPDPPTLPLDDPRRRRWTWALAPVAIAAAAVGVVLAVTAGHDPAAVRTGDEPTTTTNPPTTGADTDTVAVGDTPFRVPRRLEGFDPASVWGPRAFDQVDGGVTYHVPGPPAGTISGTVSLSVATDPDLHAALVAQDVPAILQLVYQEDLDTRFVPAGPWQVLEVDLTATIAGTDIGRSDRIYHDWLLAAGDDQVVQIISDSLDGADMLAFISRLEGPTP